MKSLIKIFLYLFLVLFVDKAFASISTNLMTSSTATLSGSTITIASLNPVANDATIVGFTNQGAGGTSAISGCNLTWAQIGSTQINAGPPLAYSTSVWYGVGSSPSSNCTITVTNAGVATVDYIMYDVSGVNSTTPIVQNQGLAQSSGATITVTLSAYGSSNNIAMAYVRCNGASYTAGTSMSGLDTQGTLPSIFSEKSTSPGSPTSVGATVSGKSSIIGFELGAASKTTGFNFGF